MSREARKLIDDGIYHVLNRGNCRMRIFNKPADFAAFIKLLEEARKRTGMRILGYCLMNNHWHLVLWPRNAKDLSRFIGWVGTTHVRRWREHRGNAGEGHLYQERYKHFLVQRDEHFLTLMRYVEANPLRAKMVTRAQDWPWSSFSAAPGSDGVKLELTDWPVEKPDDWSQLVNEKLEAPQLDRLRVSVKRERPYGGPIWLARVVGQLGLERTMRNAWRPKKKPAAKPPVKNQSQNKRRN
jgi:REP-associated tyrosine transposase